MSKAKYQEQACQVETLKQRHIRCMWKDTLQDSINIVLTVGRLDALL
jgi:hypothetical protein